MTTPSFLDGLFVAANAVADIHLVVDSPNCGWDKPGKTGVNHDLMSTLMHWSHRQRIYFTKLEANDLVIGTEEKMKRQVRDILSHQKPAFILLAQSSVVLLMGTDADAIAAELEEEYGVPMAAVPSNTLSGDYLDGYSAAMLALAKRVPLESAAKQKNAVGIVGYMMDRHEEDHQANVRELLRLCNALSLPVASIWLGGASFSELSSIAGARHILSFPYGREAAAALAGRMECENTELDLPIGLDGTARWLRAIGNIFGREKKAEKFIARELDAIAPRMEWVVRRSLANRNVALAADPCMASEITAFLCEMGMRIRVVALRTRKESAAAPTLEVLRNAGQTAKVFTDPVFPEIESLWSDLHTAGNLDLIIGTGSERDAAKKLAVPYLELGYPSYVRHALFDAPWIGFRGAAWIADVIFNLLNEWEHRKY